MTSSTDKPSVAIIGAGIAGLRAAEYLLERGFNVRIYEARDRIGGRVCQSSELGKPVDLGPNWVHGTDQNPIIPLSERAKSTLHEFGHLCPIIGPDGNRLDQKEADELMNRMWGIIDEATHHSKAHWSSIAADLSLYDYTVQKVSETSEAASNNTSTSQNGAVQEESEETRKRNLLLDMAHMWGTFIGSSIHQQSLKFFFLEEPVEGPNLFVADTYSSILSNLAAPILAANILHLSTPITSITTSSTAPYITLTSPTKTFTADTIILTIPLGSLQRLPPTFFTPPLPSRLQTAITSLSYGTLEKIYLHFPCAFWGSENAPFYSFLSPSYSPLNPSQTHMCCFSLHQLPGTYSQPTLLFYVFGDTSKYLTSSSFLPANATEKERVERYREFFRPYYSRLAGYDGEDPRHEPDKVLATRWCRDEWAGFGSYSNFQVGLREGGRDIEVLREGAEERRVWFAGEHTAPVLGLGSVSGAWWSGEGVGKMVEKWWERGGRGKGEGEEGGDAGTTERREEAKGGA
ncbi:amine oxidase [Ascodesmis nigricans]|uniref:Amine oxidase n=1 Tax=Ascodesmis nigricans TaxID=341454 RepID=A0A4S2MZS9_9PEZI|nr:amine oxidase [Ascodesmis nigricans]